jgi:hypothetical protein
MERTLNINHQGKNIYYMDFGSLQKVEEINSVIAEAKQYIQKQTPSSILALTNLEGMHFNNQIKELFTDFVKGNKPYVKASAIIGIHGLKQIVFNGIMKITGRDLRSFSDIESAKTFLVSQCQSN